MLRCNLKDSFNNIMWVCSVSIGVNLQWPHRSALNAISNRWTLKVLQGLCYKMMMSIDYLSLYTCIFLIPRRDGAGSKGHKSLGTC